MDDKYRVTTVAPGAPVPPLTIACLPGMGRNGIMFEGQWFQRLAECGARVLAVTYATAHLESMDDLAGSAWAALDAFGYKGPLVLLGYSMGGFVAEAMVHQRPADVAGLVLVSTSIPNLKTFADHIDGNVAATMLQFSKYMSPTSAADHEVLPRSETRISSDEFRRETVGIVAYIVSNQALRNIKSIQCPVLIVHGLNDTIIPPSAIRELQEAIQDTGVPVAVVPLPGVTHYIFIDAPDAVQTAILEWSRESFPGTSWRC